MCQALCQMKWEKRNGVLNWLSKFVFKHANCTTPLFPHCTLISISSTNILSPMITFKDTAKHRKLLLVVRLRNPPCPKCWSCCRNRLRDPTASAGLKLFATMPGSMYFVICFSVVAEDVYGFKFVLTFCNLHAHFISTSIGWVFYFFLSSFLVLYVS